MEQKKNRFFGIPNRYFVLAFIVLGYFAARAFPPILPHIQLPAERVSHDPLFTLPVIGDFYWTNTLWAMLLVDVILIIIALVVRRAASGGSLVPSGFSGAVEALLEVIYNLTESTSGKWAKSILPFFVTITLIIVATPGVDSIGVLEESDHGYAVQEVLPGVATIIKEEVEHGGYSLVPYVRVLSTDLNFTVGLALISVVMTQVLGVRSLGGKYFTKFINVGGLFSRPVFGVIDFGVGLLELVSEISKILSFSFRLFGNIFAGS
ncbi:MAG TPA: F0F1 ATP synthase subunit A, partial [Anaerolineales bacterium]